MHCWLERGLKNKSQTEVPVDPTDQVMLRLKLLDAFMDISRFLLAFGMTGTEEDRKSSDDITKTPKKSKLFGLEIFSNPFIKTLNAAAAHGKYEISTCSGEAIKLMAV